MHVHTGERPNERAMGLLTESEIVSEHSQSRGYRDCLAAELRHGNFFFFLRVKKA